MSRTSRKAALNIENASCRSQKNGEDGKFTNEFNPTFEENFQKAAEKI